MMDFYDREKLYNEVWAEPMSKVCKRYNISDVGLKKVCKKLKIPTPPVGFWAKKANGKEVHIPELPMYDDAPMINKIQSAPKEESEAITYMVPQAFEKATEIISNIKEVRIHQDLEDLHPYVRNTRKMFKRQVKKEHFRFNRYNRYSVAGDDVFTLDIGTESLDRASCILHTLCTAMIENDFEVIVDEGACFRIMEEKVSVKLSERSKKVFIRPEDRIPNRWYYQGGYDHVPDGVLTLEIYPAPYSMKERTVWKDTKTQNIEDKLNDIMRSLIIAAAWRKENRAHQEKREKELEIQRKKIAEKERLARIEKVRVNELEAGLKKWMHYKEALEYVNAVKASHKERIGDSDDDFSKWSNWVDEYLSRINPLNGEYPKYDVPEYGFWGRGFL